MNLVSATPTTRTFEELEVVCECEPPKRKVKVEAVDPSNQADGPNGPDGVDARDKEAARAAFQLRGDGVDFGQTSAAAAALEATADPGDAGLRGISKETPADRDLQDLLRQLTLRRA